MIGTRLKLARTRAGLSLRGLEARMDRLVTAQAIGKYERGESSPRPPVLEALALALGVTVDYLFEEDSLQISSVEFRRKGRLGKRQFARIEAEAVDALERYLAVEDALGVPNPRWKAPFDGLAGLSASSEAEKVAKRVRECWSLGEGPIRSMVGLVEEKGVRVLSLDLGEGRLDGFMATARRRDGEEVSVIVVNDRKRDGERRRFTVAHELHHLLLGEGEDRESERAAHRFAGVLLMPESALRERLGTRRTSVTWEELITLKGLFGVSLQALTFRCRELGIFGVPLARQLQREFARRGWSRPPYDEPGVSKPELPGRFRTLCLRALSEGHVSAGRAAELLGTSVEDLYGQWVDQPLYTDGA